MITCVPLNWCLFVSQELQTQWGSDMLRWCGWDCEFGRNFDEGGRASTNTVRRSASRVDCSICIKLDDTFTGFRPHRQRTSLPCIHVIFSSLVARSNNPYEYLITNLVVCVTQNYLCVLLVWLKLSCLSFFFLFDTSCGFFDVGDFWSRTEWLVLAELVDHRYSSTLTGTIWWHPVW